MLGAATTIETAWTSMPGAATTIETGWSSMLEDEFLYY